MKRRGGWFKPFRRGGAPIWLVVKDWFLCSICRWRGHRLAWRGDVRYCRRCGLRTGSEWLYREIMR